MQIWTRHWPIRHVTSLYLTQWLQRKGGSDDVGVTQTVCEHAWTAFTPVIKMDFCDCSNAAWPHKSTHVNTWNKMRMHCSPPSGTHCVHTIGVREAIFVVGDIVVQLAADVSRLCSVWLQSFSMLIPGLRRCSASFSARLKRRLK